MHERLEWNWIEVQKIIATEKRERERERKENSGKKNGDQRPDG